MERFEEKVLVKSAKYLSKGKIHAAREVVEAALQDHPESVPLLLELSLLLLRSDRREDASGCVRRALKARADAVGEVEGFAAGVRKAGEDYTAYYEPLAEHYLRDRDLPRALDTLERMREEVPALRERTMPRAQKLLSEGAGRPINPQLLPSVYLVALCHEVSGNYQAAAPIYATVLDRNPQEGEPLLARMAAVLTRDHRNLSLRLRLSEALVRSGKVKEGVQQCALAVDIDAGSAAPVAALLERLAEGCAEPTLLQAALARARARAGGVEECLRALRPLVEKGHDLETAVGLLEDLAHRHEEHAGVLELLSEAYLRRGRSHEALAAFARLSNPPPESAERVYRRVLEKDPACVQALQKLIEVLLETRRPQEASALCARLLAVEPARALLVVPQLQSLLSASPADRATHLLLARLQAHRGERERAGLLLRHLLAVDPESSSEIDSALASLPAATEGTPEARHLLLARLETALGRGDPAGAAAAARAALGAQTPALPDALAPLTRLLSTAPACAASVREMLVPHASWPGCEAAVEYLLGECAAAEGDLRHALERWKACLGARPEAGGPVRQALARERGRGSGALELDLALIDLELAQGDYTAAARTLAEVVARRPEAGAACLDRFARLLREQPKNLEVRLGLCAAYTATRQFDQALALGEETLSMEDSERTAALHLALAEAQAERGEVRRAVRHLLQAFSRKRALGPDVAARLERMRQRDPSQPLVHLALGRALPLLDRAEEAVDALAEAWRLDPAQTDLVLEELQKIQARHPAGTVLRLLLARIWASKRDFGKATEAMLGILDSAPDQARSIFLLVEKIRSDGADLPPLHLVRGRALLAQGNIAGACEAFEQVFRADPGSASSLLTWCQRAIELEPTAPEPYLLACDLNRAQKRPAAAAKVLSSALSRGLPGRERFVQRLAVLADEHREDASLLLTLAEEYLLAGNAEGALRALAEAVNRDATLSDTALEAVERALASSPDLAEGFLVRARLRSRRGKPEAALADLGEFLRRAPSRRAEALPVALTLRKREPRHLGILTAAADLLVEERRFQEALTLLKEGLASATDPALKLELYMRQWRLHLAQGKDGLARQVLENAQTLAPDRNLFLEAVHRLVLDRALRGLEQLRERLRAGAASPPEIETLAATLILLGEHKEARRVLSQHASHLQRPHFARLHAALAERRGDFRRAFEMGRGAGVDRRLVYCAERAGEIEEAHRMLSQLVEEGREVALEPRLARYELELLRRELDKGRNVLQAETVVAFGK